MNTNITKFTSFVLLALTLIFFSNPGPIQAYDNVTIVFSDIGAVGSLPGLLNQTSVTGLMVSGKPMVKLTDIASIMGASVSTSGALWSLTRASQTTTLVCDTNDMYTTNSYSYYDPVNAVTDYYSFTGNTECAVNTMWISGIRYIPLTEAALQIGALLVEPYSGTYRVYDFRIDGTTPKTDTNDYIVGGAWITGWSSNGTTNLSDHFDRDEVWSNIYFAYARQMKIAVLLLESAERVRYYYNNNSAMYLDCAFRSYAYNNELDGSGPRSYHMRGRAWDCSTDALYYSVYNEFRNGQTYPVSAGSFWRTRIPATGNSRGYEIEKMPQPAGTWLHLQRQPGTDMPDAP